MALQDISRRAGPYSWADTRTYTFGFKVFSTSQITVTVLRGTTETVLTSSLYTVTLNQDQENQPGGTVVLANGVETADKVAITSAVPYTQEMELTNQGGFYPDILNENDDRIVAQIQQLKEGLNRAIKVGPTSSTSAEAYKAELETTVNNAASDAETAAAAAEAAQEAAEAAQGAAEDAADDASDALADVTTAIAGIPTEVSTAVTNQDIPGQVATAVTAADIPGLVENEVDEQLDNTVVRVTEQTFTEAQKQQARRNLDVAPDLTAVRFEEQSLTSGQKAQARTNIGAFNVNDGITATGSTTARTLANRFADIINVKDFGAKGDGVTDDTQSIQAAFNAAVGKKVIFPAGVYVSGNVSIPIGVKAVDGMGSTLKRNQSLNQFYFDKAKDLSIENFIFETLNNTIHGGAMRGREVENVSIKNIRTTSQTPYSGTVGDWAFTLSGNDIRMSDIYIDSVDVGQWGDGIHLGQVQNFTLENFDIESGDDGIAMLQDRNCILDYNDTSTWLDGWTENVVIGNGIFRKPESGNNLFSCIKLGCNITEIDVDTSDHSIRNVLFHDIVFPDAGGRTVVLTSDDRTTINNKYKNIVFDACLFGDGTGNKAVGWDVKTTDLTFRNCNMRRNGYVQNFMQIENVDSFGMTSCNFTNDSASTGTVDFAFSDCQKIILKNNTFDRSPAGNIYSLSNCDELISTGNIFLNVVDVSVSGQKSMVTDDKTSRPLLVVIAGQDNACGDSYSPEHSPYFSENGYQFIPTVISYQSTDYSGAWKKTVYEPSCKFHGGFASALAKRLSELTGRNIWIVNVSYDSSSLYSEHTPNWSGSGTLRSRALALVNTAKSAMPSYDILGTVWLQGETDATLISEGTESLTGTNSFQYQLRYLINWLKNNIGGVVFLSKIAYTDSGSKDTTVDAVNDIIENIPGQYPETSNCYLASSLPTTFRDEGLMRADGVHYKQEGYDRLGISLATYLASFYEGL